MEPWLVSLRSMLFPQGGDHDGVRVGTFALEALEQLKASFAGASESALVLCDETLIIVRSVHHRLWVAAFSHR